MLLFSFFGWILSQLRYKWELSWVEAAQVGRAAVGRHQVGLGACCVLAALQLCCSALGSSGEPSSTVASAAFCKYHSPAQNFQEYNVCLEGETETVWNRCLVFPPCKGRL